MTQVQDRAAYDRWLKNHRAVAERASQGRLHTARFRANLIQIRGFAPIRIWRHLPNCEGMRFETFDGLW
jgi:hypothetical protein